MRLLLLISATALFIAPPAFAQELNLSRDLQGLGVSANMEPNRPDVDARPLFEAALGYIRRQRITRVTLDPGAYFFLTPHANGRYIHITNLQDVAFAFAGAHLYFRHTQALFGIQVVDSDRLTFSGFTVDFMELPFTQVRVAEVRPSERLIRVEPLPGYRPLTDFNDIRTATGTLPPLYGLALRDGTVVLDTGRFEIGRPLTATTVRAAAEGYQTDPATLARILPGDTLAVITRGNQGGAVRVDGGSEIAFEDVDVYSSHGMGVLFVRVRAARIERTRVIPRPGTDRLIATSADGLNLTLAQSGSVIRDSVVRRTMDDGIAVNSSFMAAVVDSPSPNRLNVRREATQRFENGLAVALVNTTSAAEIAGGIIVSQNPSYETPIVSAGAVAVELDRALPAVPRDTGLVFAEPSARGLGTVVENNLVEDVQYARGIYVAGVIGVTVRGNTIRRTTSGGIVIWQAMQVPGFAVGPVRDIQIVGNAIEQPIGLGTIATGSLAALGGISVASAVGGRFVTARVNSGVTIVGNRITDSGRSGIWVSSVAGGSIRDNVIERHNQRPGMPLVGIAQVEHAQLNVDFTQPVVVRNSDGISVSGNAAQAVP